MVLYEYPFNESIRTMLRLEHLFDRFGALMARDPALDHHFALVSLFEILDVASRADLKSDLLKELEKHKAQFNGYRGSAGVDEARLDDVITRLDGAFQRLNAQSGKTGAALNSNEWLMSIRSRISIPGGTCEFDLPAYYHWQQLLPVRRRKDLMAWAQSLMPLAEALQLLLGLLRDSGTPHKVAANAGQFQQSLPAGRVYQLLRMRIDPSLGLIPEITGHRLMVSIRLMRQDEEGRLKLAPEDTGFELALCQ
ncbi:cell division protein ZapD [Roseateles sp. LKC17W]|uniref:Cell division protein ZapD n=1 Tax=Pelomonas margarita TaxID=3299031 RepID=A0ABW7FJQ6_9BURK